MKLREFCLWAFTLDLAESRKFTLFNRCVCAHFERYFAPIETDGVYRVVIKLSDRDPRQGTVELSSSVLKFYKDFDFLSYNNLDEFSKKKLLLDTLYQSLIELCDVLSWRKVEFENAYASVMRDNFVNSFSIKKKSCPNRSRFAELVCIHGSSSFNCYISVSDKHGGELLRELLFSEEPDEFLFNGRIGNIKWESNSTLIYSCSDGADLKRFDIN